MRSDDPVVSVKGLTVRYPLPGGTPLHRAWHTAVDCVDLDVVRGETLAIVGESGSGKTTLGRSLLRLTRPSEGSVSILGTDIYSLGRRELRSFRRHIQMVFQDPRSSLNPVQSVATIISEPLRVHEPSTEAARADRIHELLQQVQLPAELADRLPHELSGGQRQRVAIARAIAAGPDILVCDEAVSALDVSVRNQIVHLLERLQQELALTIVFIAHDLGLIRHIAHRTAVMHQGSIIELAETEQLFCAPTHSYTAALLRAIPLAGWVRRRDAAAVEAGATNAAGSPNQCRIEDLHGKVGMR